MEDRRRRRRPLEERPPDYLTEIFWGVAGFAGFIGLTRAWPTRPPEPAFLRRIQALATAFRGETLDELFRRARLVAAGRELPTALRTRYEALLEVPEVIGPLQWERMFARIHRLYREQQLRVERITEIAEREIRGRFAPVPELERLGIREERQLIEAVTEILGREEALRGFLRLRREDIRRLLLPLSQEEILVFAPGG